jgi:hypothetical protein
MVTIDVTNSLSVVGDILGRDKVVGAFGDLRAGTLFAAALLWLRGDTWQVQQHVGRDSGNVAVRSVYTC